MMKVAENVHLERVVRRAVEHPYPRKNPLVATVGGLCKRWAALRVGDKSAAGNLRS